MNVVADRSAKAPHDLYWSLDGSALARVWAPVPGLRWPDDEPAVAVEQRTGRGDDADLGGCASRPAPGESHERARVKLFFKALWVKAWACLAVVQGLPRVRLNVWKSRPSSRSSPSPGAEPRESGPPGQPPAGRRRVPSRVKPGEVRTGLSRVLLGRGMDVQEASGPRRTGGGCPPPVSGGPRTPHLATAAPACAPPARGRRPWPRPPGPPRPSRAPALSPPPRRTGRRTAARPARPRG